MTDINLGGPKISPSGLDFGTQKKGSTTPKTLQVIVANKGNQQLKWSVSIIGGTSWLALSRVTGQVQPNAQETVNVTANTGSFPAGVHSADPALTPAGRTVKLKTLRPVTVNIQLPPPAQ